MEKSTDTFGHESFWSWKLEDISVHSQSHRSILEQVYKYLLDLDALHSTIEQISKHAHETQSQTSTKLGKSGSFRDDLAIRIEAIHPAAEDTCWKVGRSVTSAVHFSELSTGHPSQPIRSCSYGITWAARLSSCTPAETCLSC